MKTAMIVFLMLNMGVANAVADDDFRDCDHWRTCYENWFPISATSNGRIYADANSISVYSDKDGSKWASLHTRLKENGEISIATISFDQCTSEKGGELTLAVTAPPYQVRKLTWSRSGTSVADDIGTVICTAARAFYKAFLEDEAKHPKKEESLSSLKVRKSSDFQRISADPDSMKFSEDKNGNRTAELSYVSEVGETATASISARECVDEAHGVLSITSPSRVQTLKWHYRANPTALEDTIGTLLCAYIQDEGSR